MMKAREVIAKTFVVGWQQHIAADGADAILGELEKNGYAIVPISPSEKMFERAERELGHSSAEKHLDRKKFYSAMLQASSEEG